MPGAALLVVGAALRAGAGLVRAFDSEGALSRVLPWAHPEAVLVNAGENGDASLGERLVSPGEHALVLGPGLNPARGRATRAWVEQVTELWSRIAVFDAGALNALAGEPEACRAIGGRAILTPHPGEAARLLGRSAIGSLGSDPRERAAAAAELADRSGAVVVLKGPGTIVREGDRSWTCPAGGPELSSAGSGDVLCGVIGAFATWIASLAPAGFGAFEAACAGVLAHARAGELARGTGGPRGVLARDLIDQLPLAVHELEEAP